LFWFIDRGIATAKGFVFCVCLVNRGFVSAKGSVFLRSFLFRKRKEPKKTAKGVRGGLFRQGQALPKRHMPLPPFDTPNTPFGGTVHFVNGGGVTTPCLRLFLQLLFVGTPTKRNRARSQPFVFSESEKESYPSVHPPRRLVAGLNRLSVRCWERGLFPFRNDSPA